MEFSFHQNIYAIQSMWLNEIIWTAGGTKKEKRSNQALIWYQEMMDNASHIRVTATDTETENYCGASRIIRMHLGKWATFYINGKIKSPE